MNAKTVVVTGAAGGIGSAIARRFARDGARVALLDRDVDGARALAAEIGEGVALARRCDVTSLDDCRDAMGQVIATWGGIDVLVNNAGITHLGAFADTDVEVIRRVVEVNLFGAVNCTKAALGSLVARRGRIIVVSSVAGVSPLVDRTGYAASKHALHGFFDSLRAEHHDDGLGVTIVCPSFVDTAIRDRALGAHGGPAAAGAPTGERRPVDPALLADAIVRGAAKNRRLVLFPREARVVYQLARFVPRVYERLMLRRTVGS